jgi:hypothetical protein
VRVRDRETTKISQDPQTNKKKKVSTQTALRVAGPRAAVAKVAAGVGERVLGERVAERVGLKERVRDDVRVGTRILGRAAVVAAGAAAALDAEAGRGVALGLGLAHAALALEARAAVLARGAGGLRVRGRQPGDRRGRRGRLVTKGCAGGTRSQRANKRDELFFFFFFFF